VLNKLYLDKVKDAAFSIVNEHYELTWDLPTSVPVAAVNSFVITITDLAFTNNHCWCHIKVICGDVMKNITPSVNCEHTVDLRPLNCLQKKNVFELENSLLLLPNTTYNTSITIHTDTDQSDIFNLTLQTKGNTYVTFIYSL